MAVRRHGSVAYRKHGAVRRIGPRPFSCPVQTPRKGDGSRDPMLTLGREIQDRAREGKQGKDVEREKGSEARPKERAICF